MPSEHSFLRQRLALVERQLASPDQPFRYAGRGRVRRRKRPSDQVGIKYKREARLLRKLLFRAKEGQALTALKGWRCKLGKYLANHRQRYKEMQDAYDDWWELPWYRRARVPKPPKPLRRGTSTMMERRGSSTIAFSPCLTTSPSDWRNGSTKRRSLRRRQTTVSDRNSLSLNLNVRLTTCPKSEHTFSLI